MLKKWIVVLAAVATIAGLGIQPAGAQQAMGARQYRNCTAMHRDWPHGVARSRAAARREVADGYGRPHVSRRLYRANRDLDANDDGVACEA
jgi:Excalibur calcium-binding domain